MTRSCFEDKALCQIGVPLVLLLGRPWSAAGNRWRASWQRSQREIRHTVDPFDRVLRFSGQRRRVGRMWTQLWPVTNEKHKSDLASPRSMTSGCISLLTDTTEWFPHHSGGWPSKTSVQRWLFLESLLACMRSLLTVLFSTFPLCTCSSEISFSPWRPLSYWIKTQPLRPH